MKEVWTELGLDEIRTDAVREDYSGSVTLEILARVGSVHEGLQTTELVLVASWFIWWQRHQHIKGEVIQTPERSVVSIKVLMTYFVRS